MSKADKHIEPSGKTEENELFRYLKDEMSVKEKYAFERKMESDPFTYEAIEGFQEMDVKALSKDLNNLKKKLHNIDKPQNNYWKIAAVIALILFAGVSAWRLTTSPASEELATTTTEVVDSASMESEPMAAMATDSLKSDSAEFLQTTTAPVQDNLIAQNQPVTTDPPTNTEQQPVAQQQTAPVAEIADEEILEEISSENVASLEIADDLTALPAEQSGQGAGLAVQEAERNEVTPAPTLADAKTEESKLVAEDAPITNAAKKASSSQADALETSAGVARSSKEVVSGQLANPSNGWESFRKYVVDNQQFTAGMVDGDVTLSFTISAQGIPQNILVTKPLCQACDQEAIRLLQNSGTWQYNSGITGSPLTTATIQIRGQP